MTKRQSITIPVTINVSDLKELIKDSGNKITNLAAFKEYINSESFKNNLAVDLRTAWDCLNANDDVDLGAVVADLFWKKDWIVPVEDEAEAQDDRDWDDWFGR
jgi:hypothetical protein